MSYILDALKKSEQERGHGNVPGVQTIHSSSLNYRQERRTFWPYILIAAVFINIGVVVYFKLADQQQAGQAPQASSPPVSTPVTPLGAKQTGTQALEAKPDAKNVTDEPAQLALLTSGQDAQADINPASAADKDMDSDVAKQEKQEAAGQASGNATGNATGQAARAPAASNKVLDYSELSQQIKSELPAIIISAHVYSSNPVQRSIVINNDFMEEGEYLIDGLVLHEITREGAILNYHGTLFHYGAVSSWQ